MAGPRTRLHTNARFGTVGVAREHDFALESGVHAPDGTSNADKRNSPRFALLIRTAKLVADGCEFLCVVRDASATGLKVRLFTPIPPHRVLEIELGNGDRRAAELVWSEGDYAGLRFAHRIDVEHLLDESQGPYPRRQVRLRIALNAIIHSGGEAVSATFRDISQHGACVECDKWLLMNELVRIETAILPPIFAKVRWRSHPRYGLIFEQTFRLDELARIAASLQPAAQHAEPVPSPSERAPDGI